MPVSPLDFLLLQFGSPGHYQLFLGFLLCCLQLPISFTEQLYNYYTYEPPHRCQLSTRQTRAHDTQNGFNLHKNEWFPLQTKYQLPFQRGPVIEELLLYGFNSTTTQFDQCSIYLDPVHHWKGTQPCPSGWEFWLPNNEQNLVTEFNLVCERKHYLTILFNVICITSIFGSILFGLIADKWGRSKCLHITIYLFVASCLSAYFSADFEQFSLFYILQVFFISGLQISAFVLLVELFATPYQLKASLVWAAFRAATSLMVPILISAIQNWRYMQLSIAVPSFAFFTYIFVIPPSPLWLTVVKHNLIAAYKTLTLFGKFNGRELSAKQLNLHIQNLYAASLSFVHQVSGPLITNRYEQQQQQQNQQRIHPLLQTNPTLSKPGPVLRWYLLSHFYLFFVVTIISSDIVRQHSLVLHQNVQINTIYSTLLDLGIVILAYHLSAWLGGRLVQALFFVIDGLLIVAAIVLREYLKSKSSTEPDDVTFDYRLLLLPPILITFARALNFCLFTFVCLYAIKTIPTKIRATGFGFCLFWSSIAKLCVPHLLQLGTYMSHNQLLATFGIMAIIGGILTLLFPPLESFPLPNTLEDLQPYLRRYNTGLSISTLQRYPSYKNFKGQKQQAKEQTANVYMVSSQGPTGESVSQHNSMTRVKSAQIPLELNLNELPTDKDNNGRVDMQELIRLIQQNSLSSNNTRQGNETERSSLSSSRNNTLFRNGNNRQSLLQFSPSTSFTIAQASSSKQPSYIAFGSPSLEHEANTFEPEPNNEVTVVEHASPTHVYVSDFEYPRHHLN